MNKQQYAEFYKYLAIIKYEYIKDLMFPDLNEKNRKEIKKILDAIDTLLKVMIIEEK